ncbi:hypothetical protein [Shewanella algae]|uniref:hypothetical protein n=1 Tax=Shewanella algae TaxID=38313 RepID=UPI0031F4D4F0
MASQTEPENPVDWMPLLTNTAGFIWGFLLGGATGYFGNWLWDKFKPKKKNGHLQTDIDEHGTSFSGRINQDNKEQILKTLRASVTPTGTPTNYNRSGTGTTSNQSQGSSKT